MSNDTGVNPILSTSWGQSHSSPVHTVTPGNSVPNAVKSGTSLVAGDGRQGYLSASGTLLIGPHAGTSMEEWALKYAEHGYYVFPLREGSKFPLKNCQACDDRSDYYERDKHMDGDCTAHSGPSTCHGHKAATRDADVIRGWWLLHPFYNIGINVGRSGIAILDVDTRAKDDGTYKIGEQTIADLQEAHGILPGGPRVTTWSGGWQRYLTHPQGMLLKSSAGSDTHMTGLGQDVDIKALSAYAVAPPSLITGKRDRIVQGQYTWATAAWDALPPVPEWIPQVIKEREATKRPTRTYTQRPWSTDQAPRDEVLNRVHRLADEVAQAAEGRRNILLNDNAFKAFQYAAAGQIDPDEIEFIFTQAGCAADPADTRQVERTVASARNGASNKPYTWRTRGNTAPTKHDAEEAPREGQDDVDLIPAQRTEQVRGPERGIEELSIDKVYNHKPDQMGAGELYVEECDGRYPLRWNGVSERFFHYGDGHWRDDDRRETRLGSLVDSLGRKVTRLVDADIDRMRKEITDGAPDAKVLEELIKIRPNWYKTYRSAGSRKGIIDYIRTSIEEVDGEQLDADPCLMNFRNGTYDVRTGTLRAPRPDDYITHRLDREIDMTLAERPLEEVAPQFHRLITRACAAPGEMSEEAAAERVAAVARSLGGMLHGECIDKAMMVYEGAKDTGKTQLVEVVLDVIGSQLGVPSEPKLLIKVRGDRHESIEYDLKGRRIVLVNELTEQMTLDDNQVLRLVNPDGSSYSVRKLREQKEKIKITWNIAVTTNELPRARVSPQVLRRLRIFPMSQVPIPESEQYGIKQEILEKETSAVLAHLVKWWHDWYDQRRKGGSGLIVTEEMREALLEFEEDNTTLVDQFREEMTTQDDTCGVTRTNALWLRYTTWHEMYHPNEKLEYGVNRKQFWKEVLSWPGVRPEYKSNGKRSDGTPKQTLIGIRGIRVFSTPNEDVTAE